MSNSRRNIFNLIEAATNELPLNEQFLNDLNAGIEILHNKEGRKPSQSYKPSSMQCVRNMYYQIMGYEPEKDRTSAALVGILESGTDRHERLQSVISKLSSLNIDCEYIDVAEYIKQRKLDYLEIVSKQGYETKLYHKDLNISFLCDGIIRYKGRHYILEIKTETVYKFQSRKGIAPEHLAQGTTYSVCLGIDEVMFLYENRDNTTKKAYILEVTDDMKMSLVISKIELVEEHREKLKVPAIPADITKKICQYCPYQRQCKDDG